MSCVCILTPVVIAAWPAFSAAIVSAAATLGYQVAQDQAEKRKQSREEEARPRQVNLEVPHSEIVTGQLRRDDHLSVTRDGVTITFSRDARGKASLCVTGCGQTEEALRALGEELSRRVVQKYVYQRLMDEIRSRQFLVVEEETAADQTIRLKVRHWEN
jgi:hypothetical protein